MTYDRRALLTDYPTAYIVIKEGLNKYSSAVRGETYKGSEGVNLLNGGEIAASRIWFAEPQYIATVLCITVMK